MPPLRLSAFEKRVAGILACVYMARMYGLFILLPILAPAAEHLPGATPILIGVALGVYGLPQIFLHAYFGQWSDRIGRKPVIILGLGLFIVGCLIAAYAETIVGVIAGRFLQGSGAIGAVTMAFASDLVRSEQRSKVFAIMGASIGVAFLLALMTGPVLYTIAGLHGVFISSAVFAALSGLITVFALPGKIAATESIDNNHRIGFVKTLKNKELLRLDGGSFVLHFTLMANFLVLPGMLERYFGLPIDAHWQVYVPVLLCSFVLMLPFLIIAERFKKLKLVMILMVFVFALSQWVLEHLDESLSTFIVGLVLFFVAFNYLEANLPSLVSRICPPSAKGISLGVFMQSQFLGTFAGGVCGGVILQQWDAKMIFSVNLLLGTVWVLWLLGMAPLPSRQK